MCTSLLFDGKEVRRSSVNSPAPSRPRPGPAHGAVGARPVAATVTPAGPKQN